MANQEQLKILKSGVEKWNAWRKENPGVKVDLSHALLVSAELMGFNFRGISLAWADLTGAKLEEADFTDAHLTHADLSCADMRGVYLTDADMRGGNLAGADLAGADLIRANLTSSIVRGANFEGVWLWDTNLGNVDLSEAVSLDQCNHAGPSSVDHRTLEKSKNIPDSFLRGVGFSDVWIDYIRAIIANPIEFFSCFISYSHADKKFARRLHDQLQGRGIRCWLDEHQVLPGDKIYKAVDQGIKIWDKVLLCCSKDSLNSWWVDRELDTAFDKEERIRRDTGRSDLAIIPLDLDGLFLTDDWDHEHKAALRARAAVDFNGWEKDNDKFEAQFERVVRALKTTDARPEPPEPKLGR